jgi:hypothetical protein
MLGLVRSSGFSQKSACIAMLAGAKTSRAPGNLSRFYVAPVRVTSDKTGVPVGTFFIDFIWFLYKLCNAASRKVQNWYVTVPSTERSHSPICTWGLTQPATEPLPAAASIGGSAGASIVAGWPAHCKKK